MIAAASLGAGSVAPAQVVPAGQVEALPAVSAEPLIVTPAVEPEAPAPTEETQPSAPEPAPEPETVYTPGASLSETVARLRRADPGSRELECLAVGIYFESKSEPLAGQLAVGHVIANRANSRGRFPSTYCGVLTQRGQFSFVRGGRWPAVNRSHIQWRNAVAIARIVDKDLHDSNVGRAYFFHATRVNPRWRLTRVGTIGNHVFYR